VATPSPSRRPRFTLGAILRAVDGPVEPDLLFGGGAPGALAPREEVVVRTAVRVWSESERSPPGAVAAHRGPHDASGCLTIAGRSRRAPPGTAHEHQIFPAHRVGGIGARFQPPEHRNVSRSIGAIGMGEPDVS